MAEAGHKSAATGGAGESTRLKAGDGPRGGILAPRQGQDLRWTGLSYTVQASKKGEPSVEVLKACHGRVPAGRIAAIMGPSGAGKSSVLNILAGRVMPSATKQIFGRVMLGDEIIDPVANRANISYVMQDDSLLPTMTAREVLTFTTALRRRGEVDVAERTALVDEILEGLGLTECADTYIGGATFTGISGGQRKRVSVAVELVTHPKMLFLDEPTSGLDSASAAQVVDLLKSISVAGATVACTIHQPSSELFELFDWVILLKAGRVVYDGTRANMVEYFSNKGFMCPSDYNPADYAMDLIAERDEDKLDELDVFQPAPREDAPEPFSAVAPTRSVSVSDFFLECSWIMDREAKHWMRDTNALGARYGVCIFLNLIIALILQGVGGRDDTDSDNLAGHFGGVVMVAVMVMFGTAQALATEFPLQRPTFLREYVADTYSAAAYFLGKTPVEAASLLLQTALTLVITYWIMELRGNFGYLLLAWWALGLSCSATTLIVGCAVADVREIVEFISPLFVPQILFVGFFIRVNDIPVFLRWAQWLCSLKYCLSLTILIEFDEECTAEEAQVCEALREDNDTDPALWWLYILLNVLLIVVQRCIALFVLVKFSKSLY